MYVSLIPSTLMQEGVTALHLACQEGHRDVVSVLLALGADVQALTKVSHTYCYQ